jgi:hypothetical protein
MSQLPPPPPAPPPGTPPPPPAPTAEWRSLRGLTTALTVLLSLAAVVAAFGVFAFARRIGVENDIIDGARGSDAISRFNDTGDVARAAFYAFGLLQLSIFVLTIIWTFRAMKNNEALGRTDSRFTPGWGIAGWLIPCAWFVIPVLIFLDLWRGSDETIARGNPTRNGKRSGLIAAWWIVFLASLFRFGTGQGGSDNTINSVREMRDERTSNSVAMAGLAAAVAAAVLFLLVLRRIAERQESTLRAQQAIAAPPS